MSGRARDNSTSTNDLNSLLEDNRRKAEDIATRTLALKKQINCTDRGGEDSSAESLGEAPSSHGQCTAECQQLRERLKVEQLIAEDSEDLIERFRMTTDLIMRKHREQSRRLEDTYKQELFELRAMVDHERDISSVLRLRNTELHGKIEDMVAAMYTAMHIDETRASDEDRLIQQLLAENQTLRVLAGVSDSTSIHAPNFSRDGQ
ncbi:hypothetical protein SARC_00844 [Sphaeroforma arctica JP610]|uniref:Uncharacterized protein n=1 Tax=Sphaeroforma arctica JP610 TaxID=667725 RepID=A0A0L0GDP7_9EUKA|nr:hypothetical protein SARC_00844 [Sphaeroforma arctica JP610]KNC87034.1 hypothetical protein SARC_00844 [Sphaeroforma arctica JP610]|eukprot:XP_014160936.1 hypothetical protein SARC_00844 [Sphaeroforma arctica JP610]